MGIGASVLMSEFYGARDYRRLRREFSTATLAALAFSFLVAAAFFFLVNPLLRLCNTPVEIFDDVAAYLRIVAGEGEPEGEVRTEAQLDEEDEIVSEDLAAIYLAQGLHDRAVAIYRRLSLLNPEKSVYFAELIAEIEKR